MIVGAAAVSVTVAVGVFAAPVAADTSATFVGSIGGCSDASLVAVAHGADGDFICVGEIHARRRMRSWRKLAALDLFAQIPRA